MDTVERPRRLTRAEKKEQTRAALFASAQRVFERHGYLGATMDLIAADAGYTKGALYWNFESKEALFLELLRTLLSRDIDVLVQLVDRNESDPESLNKEMGEWIDRMDERDDVRLLLLELELDARRNSGLAPLFAEVIAGHEAKMADFLRRMFEILDREPPIPVDQLAAAFIMLAEGFALARRTRQGNSHSSVGPIRVLLGLQHAPD